MRVCVCVLVDPSLFSSLRLRMRYVWALCIGRRRRRCRLRTVHGQNKLCSRNVLADDNADDDDGGCGGASDDDDDDHRHQMMALLMVMRLQTRCARAAHGCTFLVGHQTPLGTLRASTLRLGIMFGSFRTTTTTTTTIICT